MYKEAFEKLNESVVQLNSVTPYMMRNDGAVFEVKYPNSYVMPDHPYISDSSANIDENDIKDSIHVNLKSLKWFYDHTHLRELKTEIIFYLEGVIKNLDKLTENEVDANNVVSRINENFEMDFKYKSFHFNKTLEDLINLLKVIDLSCNQEFLRFRTDSSSVKKNLIFRISSVEFDWFDLISNFIYDNYNQINTITISTDPRARGDLKIYKHRGEDLNYISVNDFMTLPGTPLLENLKPIEKLSEIDRCNNNHLRKGKTILELYIFSHINHLLEAVKRLNDD